MAELTQGIIISIEDKEATPAFHTIGCITDFSLDVADRSEIDVTCITDTAKKFEFGLPDYGTLSLGTNYDIDGAGQALIEASYEDKDSYNFKIEYADGANTVKSFSGFVTSYGETGSVDGIITGSINIKLNSKPVTV